MKPYRLCRPPLFLRVGNGNPEPAALTLGPRLTTLPSPNRGEGASPIKPVPLGPDRGALTAPPALVPNDGNDSRPRPTSVSDRHLFGCRTRSGPILENLPISCARDGWSTGLAGPQNGYRALWWLHLLTSALGQKRKLRRLLNGVGSSPKSRRDEASTAAFFSRPGNDVRCLRCLPRAYPSSG
jgi:hypothetical protein